MSVTELLDKSLHLIPDSVLDAAPRHAPANIPGAPPQRLLAPSYGELPDASSRAGLSMSLSALKRQAIEAAQQLQNGGKPTRAERLAAAASVATAEGIAGGTSGVAVAAEAVVTA